MESSKPDTKLVSNGFGPTGEAAEFAKGRRERVGRARGAYPGDHPDHPVFGLMGLYSIHFA